ncbi:YcbK family protein [Siculibacillus lacustris]|nr:D-Ala-D-Ala carboxypeptidase family metallohydrolase [Siculibacillus lacustris]
MIRHVFGGLACGLAVLAVGSVGIAGLAATRDEPVAPPPPLAGLEPVAAAKADREIPRRPIVHVATVSDTEVSVSDDDAFVTIVTPRLAYAATDPRSDAAVAIDTVLERPPILTASLQMPGDGGGRSLGLIDRPVISEDEDDAEIIPLPRPRPADAVSASLAMPLPKARPPVMLASLGQPETPAGEADDEDEAPKPAEKPGSRVLSFFSNPNEPVGAPKVTVDTPFGIPYMLQTNSVETACLKPELVDILRQVEKHYGRKVVITSGFRDRGRQGSLHRQCAAADIEVPGVDAASLANYSRTLPAVGGVGTYCHPHMIHLDIGAPRDWKYGCGSFFAMRGGAPGKWGKVPSALARMSAAQGATSAE